MKKLLSGFTGLLLLVLIHLQASAQSLEDAIQLSRNGRYHEAENIFLQLLAKNKQPGVLIASGYNNAWNKKYAVARQRFKTALLLDPENPDAIKGIAYTWLYEGNYRQAAVAFEKLLLSNPGNEEFHFAAALAYMNLLKKKEAQKHFEKISDANPQHKDATEYIHQIKSGRNTWEVSVIAGVSNSEDQTKYGLRQVQVSYHINTENMVYARYDNSLSLDNYFLLKNNFNVSTYNTGFYSRWHQHIGSKFEYGFRQHPGKINQHLLQTEQLVFLASGFIPKFGASYIFSNQLQDEWMLMSGVSIPLTRKFRIEPNYYFIQRAAIEQRILVNASYQAGKHTAVSAGFFTGRENSIKLNIDNRINGAFAFADFRIVRKVAGTALVRYEKDAINNRSFTAAAGIRVRLHNKK